MQKWVVLMLLLPAGPAKAADYYVATSGSNSNPGTLAQPFLTIQKAADMVTAGGNVYVRGGTYRETVTMSNSGNSSAPITFQPYGNEQVTVTGLDSVSSGWTNYGGNVWSSPVLTNGQTNPQVFLNGKELQLARWPNTSYSNPLRAVYSTVGTTSYQAPPTNSYITDTALGSHATNYWAGTNMSVITGTGTATETSNADIASSTGNKLNFQWTNPENQWKIQGGNKYFLTGGLATLDAAKEWIYKATDSAHGQVYLDWGTTAPNGQDLSVRNRSVGFDLGNNSYINVNGFRMLAAKPRIDVQGQHDTISHCQILYPDAWTAPTGVMGNPKGFELCGNYNTLQNCEIGYAWGNGVTIESSMSTVNNNVIHDVGMGGAGSAAISTYVYGNTITNNTIYNTGRDGITLAGDTHGSTISHNDISRYGRLLTDLGGIYASGISGGGDTDISYNRIHDTYVAGNGISAGVYLDSNSTGPSNGITAHNNLVYDAAPTANNRGSIVNSPGTNINLYNNTFWNSKYAMCGGASGFTNVNTWNNLSNATNQEAATGDYWVGTTKANNLRTATNQFVNSAAGDYRLAAGVAAVDYGTQIGGLPSYYGSAPDAGAHELDPANPSAAMWSAGANWKTWTAGNQAAAPLAAALYVTQSGTRVTTGSLMVGNTSSTSANSRSFLNFDLSGIVSTTIYSAVLRIYENTLPTSAAGSVTLNRVTSAWTNSNVSYGQSVDTGTPITGFYDPSSLDLYTDINITSWVQGWLSNSSTNYGLRLCGSEDVTGTAKYFDGFYGVTAPQLVITMPEPGDANLDGKVDISDLAILAANYRKHVTGGWAQADFNNDGVVDVKDLAVLAANYRQSLGATISSGPVLWDAEALDLLSLAGVTVVPEPCTLTTLAVALIGALVYTWRKRK